MSDDEGVRLQKVLSQAGIASRRVAEKMIRDGRVEVDGVIVTELGTRVDPQNSVIRVDGARIAVDDERVYLAINKPRGMHSTMSDDRGRPCVGDLVEHRVRGNKSLFHVGRLDADTEGLLLLTNDGELAHRLMHPSFEVPKTYLATVMGSVPRGLGKKLRAGVELDDGPVRVDDFAVVDTVPGRSLVKVTLHEGRKHIVRRLLADVGFPVQELVRTDIGEVTLGDQRPGSIRVLTQKEIGDLYKAVGL
ncbi:MAG: pseudouridine synthase [Actinomycetota bacterium]